MDSATVNIDINIFENENEILTQLKFILKKH